MAKAVKDEQMEADEVPRPLLVGEIVELLVGRVRPQLDYLTLPLTSWPSLLIAAVAETASSNPRANGCSWQSRVTTDVAVMENEIVVHALGGYRLPDDFDAQVFGVLAATAIKEARAAERGVRSDGYLWLRSVLDDLRLDPEDANYDRVSEAIMQFRGLTFVVSSRIDRPRRKTRDPHAPRNWITFGLLDSYEYPSDRDFQGSPVRLGWNATVYKAITTAPAASRGRNQTSEVRS